MLTPKRKKASLKEKSHGDERIYSATKLCSRASSRRQALSWRHGTYIKDQQQLQFPSALNRWCKNLAEASDAVIRKEFGRIQQMIAGIICNNVLDRRGVFFNGFGVPPNVEIQHRLTMQGDPVPLTIDGVLPFPPMPKPSKK